MLKLKEKFDKNKRQKAVWTLISGLALLSVWQILSLTLYPRLEVIPSPLRTLEIILEEASQASFFRAVFSTVFKSLYSFTLSFIPAFIFAALSHFYRPLKIFFSPFISVCRSMPTMALIFILLLVLSPWLLATSVAFLVVFPMVYENVFSAFSGVDRRLLEMADIFHAGKLRKITGIYIPAILPNTFSSIIAGFGLNMKIVIAAEVLGMQSFSIGYFILRARQMAEYPRSFAWLAVAVIAAWILEKLLKTAARLCMPWKKTGKERGRAL